MAMHPQLIGPTDRIDESQRQRPHLQAIPLSIHSLTTGLNKTANFRLTLPTGAQGASSLQIDRTIVIHPLPHS
jgi:hypothetical protein